MSAEAHIGIRGYVAVWAALVALAAATLITSSLVHGTWGLIAALSFAVLKASLVVWFFMHMSEEGLASRLAFVTAVLFLVLLISFALGDVMLRPIDVRPPV